ncbi:hypothetical protein [Streptomyces yangpuensis]|uniref:hypothetical protein n=1 Tax=Streptomyces yangpuensis TaxID=1648182 RepID=UPI00382BB213
MFDSGVHFRPGESFSAEGLASDPLTALTPGNGVCGGAHTSGGFSAASARGIPRPDTNSANTDASTTRERAARERMKT